MSDLFEERRRPRLERPPDLPEGAQALLDDIIACPDDDGPRLVYADWLMERGDPRGELIAVQCEAARLSPRLEAGQGPHAQATPATATATANTERVEALTGRAEQLLAKHKKTWTTPLRAGTIDLVIGNASYARGNPTHWTFARGFVDTLTMNVDDFAAIGGTILGVEPLRRLRVTGLDYADMSFLDVAGIARLRELDLSGSRVQVHLAEELATKALTGLEVLDLTNSGVGLQAAKRLSVVTGKQWPALWHVRLAANALKDRGTAAFARCGIVQRATKLDLGVCEIGVKGAAALAAAPLQVEELSLSYNPFGRQGAAALCKGAWPRLRVLDLSDCHLGRVDVAPLRERGIEVHL